MKIEKRITCSKCETPLEDNSRFCSSCGAVADSDYASRPSTHPSLESKFQTNILSWRLVGIATIYMVSATVFLTYSICDHYTTLQRVKLEHRIAEDKRIDEERAAQKKIEAQRIAEEKKRTDEVKQRLAESEAKRLAELKRQQEETANRILQEKQLAEENRAKEEVEAKRQKDLDEKAKKGDVIAKVVKELFEKKEYKKILELKDEALEYSGEVQ